MVTSYLIWDLVNYPPLPLHISIVRNSTLAATCSIAINDFQKIYLIKGVLCTKRPKIIISTSLELKLMWLNLIG